MMFLIYPVQSGDIALSSLDLSAVEQEWSSAQRNRSVDSHPLSIGGKTFANGVGTHASSTFNLSVNGNALRFRAMVGVDDEATNAASIQFLVYVDGHKGFDSGVMHKGPAKAVDIDL